MHQCWLWLDSFDPAKDLRRAMTPILALLMGHVLLEIVVEHPFVVGREQVFPGVRLFKAPIRHTSLHTKRRFYIILIGASFFDFLFLDTELLTYPPSVMGEEHTAIIRNQDIWNAVLANSGVC